MNALKRLIVFLVPIIIGIGGFNYLTGVDAPPPAPTVTEPIAVRAERIAPQPVRASGRGYGRVAPSSEWVATADVDGRIVSLADSLLPGSRVDTGQVLMVIDPTGYEIALSKARANVSTAQAAIDEAEQRNENNRFTLEIETRALEDARQEYNRVASLVERGVSSQALLDSRGKVLLAARASVRAIENELNLFEARQTALVATLAMRFAELDEAERNLRETEVVAPFPGRVTAISVGLDDSVRAGAPLLSMALQDSVDIEVEVPVSALRPVIALADGATDPQFDVAAAAQRLPSLGIEAVVRAVGPGPAASWKGSIDRVREALDPETGTIGLVVRVDPPSGGADRARPQLAENSFVAVDFYAPETEGLVAIPRTMPRRDSTGAPFVFVAEEDETGPVLGIRPVTLGLPLGDRVIVEDGLTSGDVVLLSVPRPAVPGLSLAPAIEEPAGN
ncbi:efflux RND transporter periplasmic adaptor subunit [Oricola sp.]|uniref:efflux RND transporter periplasmic adaptor subunit n=1 Tax=Oricola sp. TaxID=1979950 RepID=UPI003BAAD049